VGHASGSPPASHINDPTAGLEVSGSECRSELLHGNTGLPEHARERANLDFAVIRDDASGKATAQDDVTAALPRDLEAETLQGAHRLRPGNAR